MAPTAKTQEKKGPKKEPKERPKSNTSLKSRSSTATSKTKESAVLTDGSLAVLAREIGAEKLNGLVISMYLNIPNTAIVNAANDASETGLREVPDNVKVEVTQKLLLMWKRLRAGVKEKEKVRELERALKELGKPEIADVITERHSGQQELSADAFSNL